MMNNAYPTIEIVSCVTLVVYNSTKICDAKNHLEK